jgi:hypothetical protein
MKASYGKLNGSTVGEADSHMSPLEEIMNRPQVVGGTIHGYFKKGDHCNGSIMEKLSVVDPLN